MACASDMVQGIKRSGFFLTSSWKTWNILCVQETFLAKQDLDKLNTVNETFHVAGESTTDLSTGLVRGRISGGVAILWHKKYDPMISVIRLEVDWGIAIKVVHNDEVFFFVCFNCIYPV